MNKPDPRPSHIRFLVIAATMATAVLLYLDRFCISFAERFIKEDLGLTDGQMGWVLSSFFWSYALGQVPAGWLSDRYGARRMLTLYVLMWSVFTALTGLSAGLWTLLAIRFGFGLGQAGAYPTAAGVVVRWVPFSSRGKASSAIAFGGRIGGAIAPLLTAWLIVLFVPARVPSLLGPADILDLGTIRGELVETGAADTAVAPAARRRVWNELSAETRQQLEQMGSEPPNANLPARLADDFNKAIRQRAFFAQSDFQAARVPNEAEQLLDRPAADLSPAEVERLNRLLLELVLPAGVRKLYGHGWRGVMWAFGAAGIAVAGLFWYCLRDRPELHPRVNHAELAVIESGGTRRVTDSTSWERRLPMVPMLLSRSLWLSCISQFGTNLGWVFLVTWLPRYLAEVHRVPVVERGLMASGPLFIGWFGMLSGGWLTDRLTRSFGLRLGRALPMSVSRFVAMLAFLVCLLPLSPWLATAAFALVAFSTDIGTPAVWAFKQDIGGRHVGSVLGWGNMWGNIGAAVSPVLLNRLVEQYANWDAAFLACAGAFFISGIAAAGIDATKPLIRAESAD